MEYEIYLLCNILGIALIAVILLFHFVEAEEGLKEKFIIDDSTETEQSKAETGN